MAAIRDGKDFTLQAADNFFAERPFARIERLTASILAVAHAFVLLTGAERERLRRAGLDLPAVPEESLLGGQPFLPARTLIVRDASAHPRLAQHPAVIGEHGLRFIAASPLVSDDGVLLGALYALDARPRESVSERDHDNLELLAGLARESLDGLARPVPQAAPQTVVLEPVQSARGAAWELDEVRRRAREDERMRIARELHDGLGKDLFGLALLVESVAERQKGRAVSHELLEYAATARRLANEARALLRSYREADAPALPDNQFLETRLRGAVADHEDAGGPPVRLELLPIPPVPSWAVHELERIVREALRNTRRHSAANNVRVVFGKSDDELSLLVEDDGRGLPGDLQGGTYGLVGMRERAQLLGGELSVGNRPQGGVVVRGRFPLAKLAEGAGGE